MEIIIALAFADVLVVVLVCKSYTASRQRYYAKSVQQAKDRLLFIQLLVELVYTYKHDSKKMLEKVTRQMTIERFINCHLIEEDCSGHIPQDLKVREKDRLLYKLYQEGFSVQALCLLFRLNNINSVYVKCHRINKRLKMGMAEIIDDDEAENTGNPDFRDENASDSAERQKRHSLPTP